MSTLIEGECWARIGPTMPAWAPRKGARCGERASSVFEVDVEGERVLVEVCRLHEQRLLYHLDPARLARSWALDVPYVNRGAS